MSSIFQLYDTEDFSQAAETVFERLLLDFKVVVIIRQRSSAAKKILKRLDLRLDLLKPLGSLASFESERCVQAKNGNDKPRCREASRPVGPSRTLNCVPRALAFLEASAAVIS